MRVLQILIISFILPFSWQNKPVLVQVASKWNMYPFIRQASEYFAENDYRMYWDFLDQIRHFNTSGIEPCSSEDYQLSLDIAKVISPSSLSILKFSLALQDRLPKSEFYQNVAIEKNALDGCENAFIVNQLLLCGMESFESKLTETSAIDDKKHDLEVWDRLFNITTYNLSAPIAYYYQDILHPSFSDMHDKLIQLSNSGKVRYVFNPISKVRCKQKALLSGYGASLNVKKTAYTSLDDLDINLFNHSMPEVLTDYDRTLHDVPSIEIPDLPDSMSDVYLAAIKILSQSQRDLRFQTFIDLTQNFPSYIKQLKELSVSSYDSSKFYRFKDALSKYKNGESNPLIINGHSFPEDFTPFELISVLEKETKALNALHSLGFDPDACAKILTQSISDENMAFKLDIRSTNILWLNNVEKDQRYSSMSKNINQIMYYNFGETIYPLRLNIFNIVLFLDPSSPKFYTHLALISRLIQNNYPLHFGIVLVPDFNSLESLAFARAFTNLILKAKIVSAINFAKSVFEDENGVQMESVVSYCKLFDNRDSTLITQGWHETDQFLNESKQYFRNLGLTKIPTVVFNGEVLSHEFTENDMYYAIMVHYQKVLDELRMNLHQGTIRIPKKTEDSFMAGKDFYTRINYDLLNYKPNTPNLIPIATESCSFETMSSLNKSELIYCLYKNGLFYSPDPEAKFTVWLVINPETSAGRKLLYQVLQVNENLKIRYGFIFSSPPNGNADSVLLTDYLIDYLKNKKFDRTHLLEVINSTTFKDAELNLDKIRSVHSTHIMYKGLFGVSDHENYMIFMSQKFGPITDSFNLMATDFEIISTMHLKKFRPILTGTIKKLIESSSAGILNILDTVSAIDTITSFISYKMEREIHESIPDFSHHNDFVIEIPPRTSAPYIIVDAILNPISDEAKKWAGFLKVIPKIVNTKLRIFMVMDEMFSKPLSNRYYRYVLDPYVKFKNGKIDPSMSTAIFDPLPQDTLYTFHSEAPQGWFIKSDFSNCDMDNINLHKSDIGCVGLYELEFLMIEGHAHEARKGQPPSGLQLILGTLSNPRMFDTLVINNLGYFQFKVYPGAFNLGLKDQEFASYKIESIKSLTTGSTDTIIVDSFLGQLIKTKVISVSNRKKEESKEKQSEEGGGWWKTVSEYFSKDKKPQETSDEEYINIFSVATGLLYERFMRIMILSVLEHTKFPVKFWFLKNFASYQFIKSMEILAAEYKFKYEFVQYQWPHWLLKQTDKQRIIWGYKILFLDVLFPLDVKRIIFVDADQIVRADLKELYDIDLGEAPYAYTPFCDDRPEMEKFRFWKKGYWREHLRGRPYHISALYLVDLVKFREMMAGDRLRGQYQVLSRDPNSLANLDQDLPNNIQDMVPIKSLPIEWLWCETWCSDRSKEKAKTIDMCNNPLTHEAKLDRAKRIAPEWVMYDEIINNLINNCSKPVAEEIKEDL